MEAGVQLLNLVCSGLEFHGRGLFSEERMNRRRLCALRNAPARRLIGLRLPPPLLRLNGNADSFIQIPPAGRGTDVFSDSAVSPC